MDIGELECGVHTIGIRGHRREDGMLVLDLEDDGPKVVSDWPTTITLVSGTVMKLSNSPNQWGHANPEEAWYTL